MVKITYDNFKEVECDFVKYVSQKRGKFKINIIDYEMFRDELINKYSEDEIQQFFGMFPYDLDTEVRDADKIASIKLEIEFYDDLRLITLDGLEFVLVDQSTEELEKSHFLSEIYSQPIILEEFVALSFFDFVILTQLDLHYSMHLNLTEHDNEEARYIEKSKSSIYI